MTDLDGELEKLRAEARERLAGQRELDEARAAHEKPLPPPDAPLVVPEKTSLAAKAASSAAEKAAREVASSSTPKLLVLLAGLIFGGIIISRVIGPLITLAVLAIVVVLGYRFFKWLASGEDEPDEDDSPRSS